MADRPDGASPQHPLAFSDTSQIRTMFPPGRDDRLESILEALANKLSARQAFLHPTEQHRTLWGLRVDGVGKIVAGALVAAFTWGFSWYMAVNKGLDSRPTTVEVQAVLKNALQEHAGAEHPETVKKMEVLRDKMGVLRDIQVENIAETRAANRKLDEIGEFLFRARPRRQP